MQRSRPPAATFQHFNVPQRDLLAVRVLRQHVRFYAVVSIEPNRGRESNERTFKHLDDGVFSKSLQLDQLRRLEDDAVAADGGCDLADQAGEGDVRDEQLRRWLRLLVVVFCDVDVSWLALLVWHGAQLTALLEASLVGDDLCGSGRHRTLASGRRHELLLCGLLRGRHRRECGMLLIWVRLGDV